MSLTRPPIHSLTIWMFGIRCMLIIGLAAGASLAQTQVPGPVVIPGIIRDFSTDHPDFENGRGVDRGFVASILSLGGTPIYTGGDGTLTTHGRAAFDQWYRDTPGVNRSQPFILTLDNTLTPDASVYLFESNEFFPIDGMLLGNQGNVHNQHFTLELPMQFTYQGGEVITISADDDAWLFIDNRRTIDLGGVHPVETASVALDDLELVPGTVYPLHLFFADRGTPTSTLRIETTIVLAPQGCRVNDVFSTSCEGTASDDVIIGTIGDDTILGLGGNDVIFGGAGNDRIRGGTGNDDLYGQGGDDILEGGPGNDRINGNTGNDIMFSGTGDPETPLPILVSTETVTVSGRSNIVSAGRTVPVVPGCRADDPGDLPPVLDVPPGVTAVRFSNGAGEVACCPDGSFFPGQNTALAGPDGFVVQSGSITFADFQGISGLTTARGLFLAGVFAPPGPPRIVAPPSPDIAGREETLTSMPTALPYQLFYVGNGQSSTVQPITVEVPDEATRLFLGVVDACFANRDNQIGSYADNSGAWTLTVELLSDDICLTASAAPDLDTQNGGDGDDILCGGGGMDRLNGGAGNDHIKGFNGADFIIGGDGDDTIEGDEGIDTCLSGPGANLVNCERTDL